MPVASASIAAPASTKRMISATHFARDELPVVAPTRLGALDVVRHNPNIGIAGRT
jgi:hypothetical protein